MELYKLDNDINVLCIKAKSFPEGIMEAHNAIHSLVDFSDDRKYFGISYGSEKGIIYYAAAEELEEGEAEISDCESFIIKKGEYASVLLKDYVKNIEAIDETFQQLLKHPQLDPNGACIEWYLNEKDLLCMTRLIN